LNVLQTCSSTNDIAFKEAKNGAIEGSSYLSYMQTKGRGRNENKWQSTKGNLFLSTVLRPSKKKYFGINFL
jgi:biotin-(acetyl-CoA carboxylase) ligase